MASETVFGEISISPPLSKKEANYLCLFMEKAQRSKYENTELINTLYKVKPSLSKNEALQETLELEEAWTDYLFGIEKTDLVPIGNCPLELNGNLDILKIKSKDIFKESTEKWLVFLIEHFFKKNSIAKTLYPKDFDFIQEHNLNGSIYLKHSEFFKIQKFNVINNLVSVSYGEYINHPLYSTNNEKAYRKLTIHDLIKYETPIQSEILNLPKSSFLDKLLLTVSLDDNLGVNVEKPKKVKL